MPLFLPQLLGCRVCGAYRFEFFHGLHAVNHMTLSNQTFLGMRK